MRLAPDLVVAVWVRIPSDAKPPTILYKFEILV